MMTFALITPWLFGPSLSHQYGDDYQGQDAAYSQQASHNPVAVNPVRHGLSTFLTAASTTLSIWAQKSFLAVVPMVWSPPKLQGLAGALDFPGT